jgi:hypothetical protein
MACAQSKTGVRNGQCAAINPGTDPDEECTAQDPSTCGTTGVCNGSGACKKFADGTACGATCCDSGPGRGARPCLYVCHAGMCNTGAPVPTQDNCTGATPCCCSKGTAPAPGSVATCSAALACVLGGGTCM